MRFSVIIPTYNCERSIRKVLQCLFSQTFPKAEFEVICVDDFSTDNTLKIIKKFPKVHLIALPVNRGNGVAKNVGVAAAHGDIHFFVDDHMYLDSKALSTLDNLFRSRPFVSGICGMYESPSKSDYNIIRDIRRRTIYQKNEIERRITASDFYPFSITIGAIRKRLFKKKSFPETFGKNGAEDVLLQILHLHDKHVFYYSPKVKGKHDHKLSAGKIIKKLFIELNGTDELFHDISNKHLRIPYQYGFLSCPFALFFSLIFTAFNSTFAPLTIALFLLEFILAAGCLTDRKSTWSLKVEALVYVLAGEFMKLLYIPAYVFGKAPSYRIVIARVVQLLFWEKEKFTRLAGAASV